MYRYIFAYWKCVTEDLKLDLVWYLFLLLLLFSFTNFFVNN
jgi:hypothetical protein